MNTPLAHLEDRIAKLEAAAADARAATREAHEATKHLRRAEKDCRDLLRTEAGRLVQEAIDEAVKAGLTSYSGTIKEAMDTSVAHVQRSFKELSDILLGEGRDGPPLKAMARGFTGDLSPTQRLRLNAFSATRPTTPDLVRGSPPPT